MMTRWIAGTVLAFAAAAGAAKLDTSTLTGAWAGTWTNDTFATGGTIGVTTTPQGDSEYRVDWAFTGTIFGCPQDGSPVGGILLKGVKSNGYSAHKIFVKGQDSVFGKVTIKNKGTKFFGHGTKPCGGVAAKSYNATATFDGTTMTGTMKIKLTGGGTAKAGFTVSHAS